MNNINFKSITLQNFMKYGNKKTKFEFTNGIHLVTGKNGAGKSSLFLALHYCLFGKTYNGKTIGSLVNNINKKGMYVEVEMNINGDEFTIKRGTNPSIFEIYKNNELIPLLSTNSAYQEFLENNILKFTEQAFRNLIYLGGDLLSQSFVRLSKKEKEDVFAILSDTATFLELTEKIKLLKKEKTTIQTNTLFKINTLQDVISKAKIKYEYDLKAYNDYIENKNNNINEIENKIKEESKKIEKLKELKTQYDSILTQDPSNRINDLLKTINEQKSALQLMEKYKMCKGCEKLKQIIPSNIDVSNHDDLLKQLEVLQNENEVYIKNKDDIYIKMLELKPSIENKKIYEDLLEKSKVEHIEKPSNDDIILNEKELQEVSNEYNEINTYISNLNQLEILLNNNNLKGAFLNMHLPFINKTINKYINMFDEFNFTFLLDSNLKETITKDNKPFEYKSMSNGEALRLTFSIMLAFLDICRNKFDVKCNLLILDEVLDSSLDSVGKNELLKILTRNTDLMSMYVISHNSEIKNQLDYFTSTVNIINDGKFSEIEYK
ncbi:exonuclease [Campylobacter phage NCTC12673]|uniref:Recombination endonuclease n=2 Tax=Fletchervirus NCTC12673 TaxID=934027 RepID=A0A1B0XVX8_9CAUD|nr:exonuclease [Campylobacter phage NCTC12673]YP_009321604.1 exonuclease [Campylobacter phage PC14]AEA86462.1 gp46 recombination endonuclease [Campylobacter phage NCTC12673]ANH51298.2 recombination endonuclease [Campylobacter phage PC14]